LIENSILKCVDKLTSLPENTVAITCKLIYPDGRIQHQCNRFPNIANEFLEFTRIHKLFTDEKKAKQFLSSYFDHLTDVNPDWFWGTFFMFRYESLSLLPGNMLNDDYFMYAEDMKWCYDFKVAGKQVYYCSGTTVVHLSGQSFADKKNADANNVKNELDFILKTKGWLYMVIYRFTRFLNVTFSSSST
jgi:GT2 family glycosyltransferase